MRISEHVYAAGLSQPSHAHGTTSCSILLAGTLSERVGSREEIGSPLSIVFKPLDTEHANRFGPSGARLIRITLSGEDAAGALEWTPALRHWQWTHCGPAARHFLQLVRTTRSCPCADELPGARAETLVWDTLAAVAAEGDSRRFGGPPAWLVSSREALCDTHGTLRLSALASSVGVHPVYLARQFRRFFGCSISGYVHQLRVQRAADLIADGGLPLSHIALVAGFTDQSHMCRIFRRVTGLTPTAYQRLGAEDRGIQEERPGAAVRRFQDKRSAVRVQSVQDGGSLAA